MENKKGKWSVLTVLAMASFIMVIDSTAMNVSISNLVEDLNTDIGTIQTIMSMYTLIMAVFMLPGAKLADIFGKKRIFIIGVCLYGVGTLTAALAVNTVMLFIGWAVIEGLASSLMMPTALSLITSAYEKKDRAIAMSIYTAMSSVALAIGPIFGGLITSYLSWRYVFAIEVLIVIYIILNVKTINNISCPNGDKSQRFDIPGTALSGVALLCVIVGALSSSVILVAAGIALLIVLGCWLVYAKKKSRAVLIDVTVFKSRLYVLVLVINFFVQICLMATMFIISVYLQNVLRYDAFNTGLTLMPLSVLLFVVAFVAVKAAQKIPERFVIAFGALCIFGGALYMYINLLGGGMITGTQMMPSLALLGMGIGCTLSMTGNIGLSDIDAKYTNQGSGMITTINNFASSMSTAVFGSLFMGGIGPGIFAAFSARFPEVVGHETYESAAIKLEAAFQKVKVMNTDISTLPQEQKNVLKEIIVNGVDNAMLPIFMVIMIFALAAAFIAAFLLKKKK